MRKSNSERKTLETEILVDLNLDGKGQKSINTGIKFFDHMLEQLASHGSFDIDIKVNSIDGDPHHIVEDTALTLGEAFKKALGSKKGINRYGYTLIPMDESLTISAIDLSGRPCCVYNSEIKEEKVRDLDTILIKHFFESFSFGCFCALHIKLMYGTDPHHKIESMFKSFARSLKIACSIDEKNQNVIPSTKGTI